MKEAYVSFELAKLLEEKGFDEKTATYYEDGVLAYGNWFEWNRSPFGHIAAPTHKSSGAWLREKGFEIGVFYLFKAINPNVTVFDGYIPNVTQVIDGIYKDSFDMDVVKDYNNAVEAALKYAIENLI